MEGQSDGGLRAKRGPGSPSKWKREPRQLCPEDSGAGGWDKRQEKGLGLFLLPSSMLQPRPPLARDLADTSTLREGSATASRRGKEWVRTSPPRLALPLRTRLLASASRQPGNQDLLSQLYNGGAENLSSSLHTDHQLQPHASWACRWGCYRS